MKVDFIGFLCHWLSLLFGLEVVTGAPEAVNVVKGALEGVEAVEDALEGVDIVGDTHGIQQMFRLGDFRLFIFSVVISSGTDATAETNRETSLSGTITLNPASTGLSDYNGVEVDGLSSYLINITFVLSFP